MVGNWENATGELAGVSGLQPRDVGRIREEGCD